MDEIADLRGQELSWILGRRFPLHCVFRSSTGATGHIVPSLDDASILATLAGVRWKVAHDRTHDVVAFEGGPKVADARLGSGGYEVEIDGFARYRFQHRKAARWRRAWIDDAGRSAVLFAPHERDGLTTSGEIVVSVSSRVEHPPILILLGVVHLSSR